MDHKTLKMKQEVKKVNTLSVSQHVHDSLIGLSQKKKDRRRAQLLFLSTAD